jgi:hypothetical protein
MALTDNIASYWKLDETSGNAADSVGSNTLTNTNTVTYVPGKINNGADFEASSSQYFEDTTPSGINMNSAGFTVSFWAKPEALSNTIHIAKGTGGTGNEYFFFMGTDGKINFGGHNTLNAEQSSGFSTTALSTSEFKFVVGRYTGTHFSISINAVTENSAASTGTLKTNQGTFYVGRQAGGTPFYADGITDEIGIWQRSLSDAEVTQLYNGGAGIQYPFFTGPTNVKSVMGVTAQ